MNLTTDKKARKEMPIARGLLDYFPNALAEVANVSYVGNQQHNPGEELHWARNKSTDQADCIARHLIDRGTVDDDGLRHSAKLAWRALALLQLEIEADQVDDSCISVGGLAVECGLYKDPAANLDQRYREAVDLAEHLKGQPKTVYISGPMRGKPNHNFPAFDSASEFLRRNGYTVISPADMDRDDNHVQHPNYVYADRDYAALRRSTHIAMLPGWRQSVGAKAEYHIAKWLNLIVLDARTGEALDE